MVKISMNYLGDLQFKASHGPSGSIVMTDAPVDNQGKGRSFSPSDLLATSVGACMGTIMGIVSKRHTIDLTGMTITVEKEMTSQPVRRVGSLNIDITAPAAVSAENRKLLETAAGTCPVCASINPEIKVQIRFHWQ